MNAVETTRTETISTSKPTGNLLKTWAAGTAIAILLVATTYLLSNAVSGPLVVTGAGEIALVNVIGFAILGSTVGGLLAHLVGRFARQPRLTFVIVTLTALAGYAVVPFTAAETIEAAVWLNVFHLVVAVPVIGMLARYLGKEQAARGA